MRFENMSIRSDLDVAVFEATRLLTPMSRMILEIEEKNDFQYESGLGVNVARTLLEMRDPIKVYTYKPWNPWTKAIGYFDGKAIHVSLRALDWMTIQDMTANLLHEYAHYCGFHHGNNYKTRHKIMFSVPYFISENIRKWL